VFVTGDGDGGYIESGFRIQASAKRLNVNDLQRKCKYLRGGCQRKSSVRGDLQSELRVDEGEFGNEGPSLLIFGVISNLGHDTDGQTHPCHRGFLFPTERRTGYI